MCNVCFNLTAFGLFFFKITSLTVSARFTFTYVSFFYFESAAFVDRSLLAFTCGLLQFLCWAVLWALKESLQCLDSSHFSHFAVHLLAYLGSLSSYTNPFQPRCSCQMNSGILHKQWISQKEVFLNLVKLCKATLVIYCGAHWKCEVCTFWNV